MRSLYWKIFISFWLATILIIITTAWITSHIAKKSSIPAREQVFMDSYANAAVATYEAGKQKALKQWLEQTGRSLNMNLYLVSSEGDVVGHGEVPQPVRETSVKLVLKQLDPGIVKTGKLFISHEIISPKKISYRLVALSDKPLSHFVSIPWAGLTIRLIIAVFFSGLICYLLSLYLTQPIRSLQAAARSLAQGKLSTRVGKLKGHHKDEIDQLIRDFDRMAAQLESMVLAKERLLQDISHELRSPLARLNVAIELARTKTKDSKSDFDRMETECIRLNNLIGEMLEFARLAKANTVLNLKKVNISSLVESIIDDANYEFSNKNIHVEIASLDECEAVIDEKLIHRAIENIIRNALNYSDKKIPVIITLLNDKNNDIVNIIIEDSGPGVPDNELKQIFNPFHRVDSSREKRTGGYGLGLAIAHRAIELHSGTIKAENRTPTGLKVKVSLPLNKHI